MKTLRPIIPIDVFIDTTKNNPYFETYSDSLANFESHDKNFHTMTTLLYFQYLFKPQNGNDELYKLVYLDQLDEITQGFSSRFDNMIIKQFNKSIFREKSGKICRRALIYCDRKILFT